MSFMCLLTGNLPEKNWTGHNRKNKLLACNSASSSGHYTDHVPHCFFRYLSYRAGSPTHGPRPSASPWASWNWAMETALHPPTRPHGGRVALVSRCAMLVCGRAALACMRNTPLRKRDTPTRERGGVPTHMEPAPPNQSTVPKRLGTAAIDNMMLVLIVSRSDRLA